MPKIPISKLLLLFTFTKTRLGRVLRTLSRKIACLDRSASNLDSSYLFIKAVASFSSY